MKITVAALTALVSLITVSNAFDFSYGYKTIYDANADLYVFGTANVRKYTEPFGSPPALYWGPTANSVTGLLTMRFDFSAPTTLINLQADLASFNFAGGGGTGSGASSLWASTNGSTWTLLLDNPTPATIDSYKTYQQNVPAALLGATSFYVQTRLIVQGAPNTNYTDGQFSRSDTNRITDVFHINASVVPEPTSVLLLMSGAVLFMQRRSLRIRNGGRT